MEVLPPKFKQSAHRMHGHPPGPRLLAVGSITTNSVEIVRFQAPPLVAIKFAERAQEGT